GLQGLLNLVALVHDRGTGSIAQGIDLAGLPGREAERLELLREGTGVARLADRFLQGFGDERYRRPLVLRMVADHDARTPDAQGKHELAQQLLRCLLSVPAVPVIQDLFARGSGAVLRQ